MTKDERERLVVEIVARNAAALAPGIVAAYPEREGDNRLEWMSETLGEAAHLGYMLAAYTLAEIEDGLKPEAVLGEWVRTGSHPWSRARDEALEELKENPKLIDA